MATLPRFSRGLKLSRFGIMVMLLQLALSIVMTVKSMTASDMESALSVIKWTNYFMLANITATALMLVGTATSIGELGRAGLDTRKMIIAAVGFGIATVALVWTYRTFGHFVDAILDPEVSIEGIEAATANLEPLKFVTVAKDIAYGLGLIMVLRTVQQSAAANDQLGLRDEAGHMSRALIVMLLGDVFYQLTYGLGGVGLLGAVGSLLIAIYWIWCHVKLVRFFEGAAHFVNEPHDLPVATVLKVPEMSALKPKPPTPRQSRPSMPKVPSNAPPIVVIQPPAPAPVPRADTADGESDGPTFLR